MLIVVVLIITITPPLIPIQCLLEANSSRPYVEVPIGFSRDFTDVEIPFL
jgi:hypothetical protein